MPCRLAFETSGLDTSFETNPPLLSAAESGWGELTLNVSETVVFETVSGEFVNHESGRKGRRKRSGLNQTSEVAKRAPTEPSTTYRYSNRSEHTNPESYRNIETEYLSHFLFAVTFYFAEHRTKKISRRSKAGLERARQEGKDIGRPSKFDRYKNQLKAMREDGCSKAERTFEGRDEAPDRTCLQHGPEVPGVHRRVEHLHDNSSYLRTLPMSVREILKQRFDPKGYGAA